MLLSVLTYIELKTRTRQLMQLNHKTTSLTNHWQKAGPIHSLAWTPQSIHMAFF